MFFSYVTQINIIKFSWIYKRLEYAADMKSHQRVTKHSRKNKSLINATLTHHAKVRLLERFKIAGEEFLDQMNAKLYIPLHCEESSSQAYRLIYSRDDAGWIVVIQDRYNKEIISVWPPKYFEDKHRKLKPEERRVARRIVHWGRIKPFPEPESHDPVVSPNFIFNLPIAA